MGEEFTFRQRSTGTEYTKVKDSDVNLKGVFDAKYQIVDPETEEIISTNRPGIGVNLNDFEVIPIQQDEIMVRGIWFRISDKQEDGQGGAVFLLNKVNASDRIDYAGGR